MRPPSPARALPLVLPALAALSWWAATREGGMPRYLLPSPAEVWEALTAYVAGSPGAGPFKGRFAGDLAASLSRVCGGFALAAALGLPLGVASGRIPALSRLLAPMVDGLRSVPGICWLPLAIVWLGIGTGTTLFLVALAAFFPIHASAAAGAAAVPPVLVRAGVMLGLSPAAVFLRIVIPAAMPRIRTGLRLGLGVGFAYLVLGELTGVPDGIGAMIMDARLVGRVDMIVAGILLLSGLGWLGDALLASALRLAFKGARLP